VIIRLLKLEQFQVSEEALWSRLVEWVACSLAKHELLGPLVDALPDDRASKRQRSDDVPTTSSHAAEQNAILQTLAKHMRFASMTPKFFCNCVRLHLEREDSDNAMMFYLLKTAPPQWITSERSAIFPKEEQQCISITSTSEEAAAKLLSGSGEWEPTNAGLKLAVTKGAVLTKVKLFFSPGRLCKEFVLEHDQVSRVRPSALSPSGSHSLSGKVTTDGRMMTVTLPASNATLTKQLTIKPVFHESPRFQAFDRRNGAYGLPIEPHAKLSKVEVFGKMERAAFVAEFVHKSFSDLRVTAPTRSET